MPDLQAFDAGLVGIARLQGGDDAARFVAQGARFVERRVITFADKAAVTLDQRQLIGQRPRKFDGERRIRPLAQAQGLGDFRRHVLQRAERICQIACRAHAIAYRGKVARAAALQGDARQCSRQIGRCLQPRAGIGASRDVVDEAGNRIEAQGNRLDVGQRRRQPLRQQARTGRGYRAVDAVEQRAASFARQGPHQFEIAARRLIDRHGGGGCFAQRRRQRRALADLRAFDISDAGRGGGQFEPRQQAEGLAGRHREKRRQPPLGGGAVEDVTGQRRYRRQFAP